METPNDARICSDNIKQGLGQGWLCLRFFRGARGGTYLLQLDIDGGGQRGTDSLMAPLGLARYRRYGQPIGHSDERSIENTD